MLSGALGTATLGTGGGGYTPSVFLTGALTADWDAKNLATQFQDSTGTTPVASSGDPVGLWNDATGNGFNALQATAGARLTALLTGSLRACYGDAVDDNLLSSYSLAAGDMTIVIDVDVPASLAASQIVVGANLAPGIRFLIGHNVSGNLVAGVGSDGTAVIKDAVDWRGSRCIAALVYNSTLDTVRLLTANGIPYDAARHGSLPTGAAWRLGCYSSDGTPTLLAASRIARIMAAPKVLTLAQFDQLRAAQVSYNS